MILILWMCAVAQPTCDVEHRVREPVDTLSEARHDELTPAQCNALVALVDAIVEPLPGYVYRYACQERL